ELVPILQESMALFDGGNENHRFTLEFAPDLRPVIADAGRLRQVLSNLLANAVKYSPQGGDVAVKVSADAHEVTVSITDPGIGIPADAMPFLFSKFFRVH